jgi:signal transduction histidine kinase
LPSRPCPVRGDAEAVSQVVRHIVQNALEAVAAEGRVELQLLAEPDDAILKVTDDGPGMTAEFIRDKLFRPFSTTKASGYGIGAYQARELIRGMGGRLDVASVPGEGTQVVVRLTSAPAEAAISRQVQEA